MSTSCIPDPSVSVGVTLGVCATLQLLARMHASVDVLYHLPSPLGRLVGCPEEVSLASFPVVLRNLFHWSQAPPGVREMSSFYPGANHLMDTYLTRPSSPCMVLDTGPSFLMPLDQIPVCPQTYEPLA